MSIIRDMFSLCQREEGFFEITTALVAASPETNTSRAPGRKGKRIILCKLAALPYCVVPSIDCSSVEALFA